jgi:hypothetical protein
MHHLGPSSVADDNSGSNARRRGDMPQPNAN